MKVGVLGLWHLGCVTAAGLAALGHWVVGLDFDAITAANLNNGIAPIFEPGLEALIKQGIASGRLSFSSAISVMRDIDVLWVTYDTPIDRDGNADVDFVIMQIERALGAIKSDVSVLISSQLPVGSTRRLERPGRRIAYSPENLRLGTAVADFLHPQRIVVGIRSSQDKEVLGSLLHPISESIEWMSVESAQMTKHAINAFFAASVVFANEIAALCESVGADAKEVERGLKSEPRIGHRAYLAPGAAFAGGTLARDIAFLEQLARANGVTTPLLSAVLPSNDRHRHWVRQKLRSRFVELSGITIAVWGLTYKPGTDTLRRSLAAELCEWLIGEGAAIRVHDPAAKDLPKHWDGAVKRCDSPLDAIRGAQVLVIATEWPIYREIGAARVLESAADLLVLDANRFLSNWASADARLKYLSVGMPWK